MHRLLPNLETSRTSKSLSSMVQGSYPQRCAAQASMWKVAFRWAWRSINMVSFSVGLAFSGVNTKNTPKKVACAGAAVSSRTLISLHFPASGAYLGSWLLVIKAMKYKHNIDVGTSLETTPLSWIMWIVCRHNLRSTTVPISWSIDQWFHQLAHYVLAISALL